MSALRHELHLAGALADLLGESTPGAVAFLRCLPSAKVDALIDLPDFLVPGWNICAVVDVVGPRRITADQAVELREDKATAVLLLVDPQRAGAGLDGIYSAGREIGEAELFALARARARKPLRDKAYLDAAVRRAERMGRRRRLTPWQVFDFYVAAQAEGYGAALARLGLWPSSREGTLDDIELSLAAEMADRLLFAQDIRTIADRVRALLLDDPTGESARALERFLHTVAGKDPLTAAMRLMERPDLWLGPLQPRFTGEALRIVRLESWRDSRGALRKWSGLTAADEDGGKPRLLIDRSAAAAKDQARLTVRWTTEPDQLAKGSVEYRVVVMAGDEVLAEQVVAHKDKQPQQAAFGLEDFEELDSDAKFEAHILVAPLAVEGVQGAHSEEFVLGFDTSAAKTLASSGRIERTLVDGGIALAATRAAFDDAIAGGHLPPRASEDKKGYVIWKGDGARSVRVVRPALIRQVEEDWVIRLGAVGRWTQRVRADGSPEGAPEFLPIGPGTCDAAVWKRFVDASARMASDLGPHGLLARIQGPKWRAGDDYVAAWLAAVDVGEPNLALHGTVEVQSLSGRSVGLIVTPLHPIRVAWHGLYDVVAAHARYEEEMAAPAVQKLLSTLDSAHFPMALPGLGSTRGYVFADVLGFHAVAMVPDGEQEPKAIVSLLSACLGGGRQAVAPSVGAESAAVLAREIRHYLDCHQGAGDDRLGLLSLQAWRPGDGATVARALGAVLRDYGHASGADADDVSDAAEGGGPLCFTLDLYHPTSSDASGRFLADVARRRRSGGGVLEPGDRWMTETAPRPGGILLPRLRWAKRDETSVPRATHLSLAFDVFEARLEVRPIDSFGPPRPLHSFGLAKSMERRVTLEGEPEWIVFSPPSVAGEKAPDNRGATDRLLRVDAAVARATSKSLGGTKDDWPVLVTRLPEKGRRWIDRLHERSDWVITIDRNACVEYFDAPQHLPEVYERFVIDAVPERADLGAIQLVTSTSNLDAVRDLVDHALGDMGLSSSERNSRFLIGQLKALSGRLAIRLANAAGRTGELIALALMHANCAAYQTDGAPGPESPWLDLSQGFLVPVDEIADLTPILVGQDATAERGARRPDFIHVRVQGRGTLEFRFIEVKHRLHLRTARQSELLAGMLQQTGDLRRRWMKWFFDDELTPATRAIRRSQLVRILHFYAERASRHRLSAKSYERLRTEIDQVVLRDRYKPAEVERPDVGYVFCPEQRAARPEPLYAAAGTENGNLWLFGPALLPDEQSAAAPPEAPIAPDRLSELTEEGAIENRPVPDPEVSHDAHLSNIADDAESYGTAQDTSGPDPVDIVLGDATGGLQEIEWRVSIRANPHLLMVGLPGMGKTTCLINICSQLAGAGITPVVFSYHDDIDTKLGNAIGPLRFVDYDGLGFNPLRVDNLQPKAHVDVAGTLRDIFASIFPDLGDIQLEELRQAIKQSYDDLGWGKADGKNEPLHPPAFRTFYDILGSRTKPNQNLLARLRELHDYGFFDGAGERSSLLDEQRPTVVRVHGTTNSMLQNAFSSFVLFSIYKDMFRRGVQGRLTHAIVFDEAHRAARLKLIPQLAKECRKFGLALALASQEAKDFNPALFSAVGSYLVLRVTEADARVLARMTGSSDQERKTADRLKAQDRYSALFFGEGRSRPTAVRLRT